jgi:hypothetical protein
MTTVEKNAADSPPVRGEPDRATAEGSEGRLMALGRFLVSVPRWRPGWPGERCASGEPLLSAHATIADLIMPLAEVDLASVKRAKRDHRFLSHHRIK